jgi:hypothetical protein
MAGPRILGMDFARSCMALAMAQGRTDEAADIAARLWGTTSTPALIVKTVVQPATTFNSTWAAPLAPLETAAAEFVDALRPRTILGRLAGVRRAPLRIRIPRTTLGSSANWVGEASPTPVSAMTFDTDSWTPTN